MKKRFLLFYAAFVLSIALLPAQATASVAIGKASDVTTGNSVFLGRYPQSFVPGDATQRPATGALDVDYILAPDYTYTTGAQLPPKYFLIEPVEWRVLRNAGDRLFVISQKHLDRKYYHASVEVTINSITWAESDIREWLNDGFYSSAFAAGERSAIAATYLVTPKNPAYDTPGGSDTNDKIFLLSIPEFEEAEATIIPDDPDRRPAYTDYGATRSSTVPNTGGIGGAWWLRSPGTAPSMVAVVTDVNTLSEYGSSCHVIEYAVCPALNFKFDPSSVLFTSAASGANSKNSVNVGAALAAASAAATGPLKLTLKDDAIDLTSVTLSGTSGRTLTFDYSYSGAAAGKTLSAVVTDSEGAVTHYGRLSASVAASGSASVTVPDGFTTGSDELQIFVEEINGDNLTDFASALVQLTGFTFGGIIDAAEPVPFTSPDDAAGKMPDIDASDLEVVDGKVVISMAIAEAIADKLGGEYTKIVTLPCFEVKVGDGETASVRMQVTGAQLGTGYAKDIALLKVMSRNNGEYMAYAIDSAGYGDGKFTLLKNGASHSGAIDPEADYDLVVFIKDGEKFDLDNKINGEVIDPLVVVHETQSTGSPSSSGSSGGGCNAGAGIFGLSLLAVYGALRRRSR